MPRLHCFVLLEAGVGYFDQRILDQTSKLLTMATMILTLIVNVVVVALTVYSLWVEDQPQIGFRFSLEKPLRFKARLAAYWDFKR